jgi:hypothetical protein
VELNIINNLLSQVESLNSKYRRIAELTGENFNIFRILKLEASEVRLHSSFISELLNPNGSHGQKDLFLNLFVREFEFRNNNFESDGASVEIEKHTGFINDDQSEGGRIDIIITDRRNNHIIIENKIHADDKIKQLLRYKHHSKKADLFYLTLDGKEPKEYSKTGLEINVDFKCLSYKDDISRWLEYCRKEVATLPIIRETITQYLNLIKHLNSKSINSAMTEELSAVINSNIEAAFIVANNLDVATNKLLYRFRNEMQEIAKEIDHLGLTFEDDFDIKRRYMGFHFYKPHWEHCSICFSFQEYSKYLIYGICTEEDPIERPIPLELRSKLESLVGVKSKNIWWPIQMDMEAPFNQNWAKTFEPWKAIANGNMKNIIKKNLLEIINLIGETKL